MIMNADGSNLISLAEGTFIQSLDVTVDTIYYNRVNDGGSSFERGIWMLSKPPGESWGQSVGIQTCLTPTQLGVLDFPIFNAALNRVVYSVANGAVNTNGIWLLNPDTLDTVRLYSNEWVEVPGRNPVYPNSSLRFTMSNTISEVYYTFIGRM